MKWQTNHALLEDFCRFNASVYCPEKNRCDCCGWNPEVAARRAAEVRRRRAQSRPADHLGVSDE